MQEPINLEFDILRPFSPSPYLQKQSSSAMSSASLPSSQSIAIGTPNILGPPQFGSNLATFAFVLVGTLAAIIWDILSNINTDFHILHHFPITFTTSVYFLSRVVTLAAFVVIVVADTLPMANCSSMLYACAWMMGASLSTTTLLFFLRVRAIFTDRKYVVAIFFAFWLAVVAGCVAEAQGGIKKEFIPKSTSGYCVSNPVDFISLVTTMTTIPMANNALSFFAVTWRLIQNSPVEPTFQNGIKVAVLGRHLPVLSRVLLKDGQVYFLSTVSLALISTIAYHAQGTPRLYSIALVFPNIAVMNLMGCRIFRNTKLGYRRLTEEQEQSSLAFRSPDRSQNVSSIAIATGV